jgi:hypothetical protein
MRLAQISHFLLHIPASKTRERADQLQTCLAVIIGVFFGLIMGMTAMATLLGPEIASKSGILLPKVLILLTFIILSVFLFTRRSDSDDEEDENFN